MVNPKQTAEFNFWKNSLKTHRDIKFNAPYHDFIRRKFDFMEGHQRLEVGSGPCGAFRKKDMTLIGVDPLMDKYVEAGYPTDWFTMVQFDGIHLPFANESFDRIYFINVLDHMSPEEREPLCKDINRVLTPNGTLSFFVDFQKREDNYHYIVSKDIVNDLFVKSNFIPISCVFCPSPHIHDTLCMYGEYRKNVL